MISFLINCNEMKICVLLTIVALILLIAYVYKYVNIQGGAMPPSRLSTAANKKNQTCRLSLSQMAYIIYGCKREGLYQRTQELCVQNGKKHNVSRNSQTFHIALPKEFKASHVSDAFIDLIAWQELHFDKPFIGFAAEEVQSDSLEGFDNEVWSMIRPGDYSEFEFHSKLQDAFASINKHASIASTYLLNSSTFNSMFRISKRRPLSRTDDRCRRIHRYIYIEFIYTSMKTAFGVFYKSIHDKTRNIFEELSKNRFDVAIIRLERDANNRWISELEYHEFGGKLVVRNALCKTTSVHLPSTNGCLLMDEAIIVDDKLIQIEDSEDGSMHKNNMIEFTLRWLNENSMSDKSTFDLLKYVIGLPDDANGIIFNFIDGISISDWRENAIAKLLSRVVDRSIGTKSVLGIPSPKSSARLPLSTVTNRVPVALGLFGFPKLNKTHLSISSNTFLRLYLEGNTMRIEVNDSSSQTSKEHQSEMESEDF